MTAIKFPERKYGAALYKDLLFPIIRAMLNENTSPEDRVFLHDMHARLLADDAPAISSEEVENLRRLLDRIGSAIPDRSSSWR